jgi:hypothetical protein
MNTEESLPRPVRAAAALPDEANRQPAPAQRWLARLSIALLGVAVVLVGVFAGLRSLVLLAVGLAGAAVSLAAAYFFLSRRGVLRWVSLAVFVLAPVGRNAEHHLTVGSKVRPGGVRGGPQREGPFSGRGANAAD